MSVHIQFDQSDSRCYTNLDFISGTVVLILPNDATISAVTVKLEGESRTRLAGLKFPGNERSDKKRTELEVHKVGENASSRSTACAHGRQQLLYKVVTVFPTPEIQERSSGSAYTLLAGQYLYPFRFKFPINNDCTKAPSPLKDIKVGQLNVQFALDTTKHVKKTLPPSLGGFPGEAEIKYYVKATVVRPKFFQENIRSVTDVKFLPIEPPRPADRNEETFARRKRQFQRYPADPQKKGLFRKSSTPSSAGDEPPAFQVDARLPSPAIITCNEPLPLRILVEKLNDSSASVFLSMLQIELIGYTQVRAHDLERTESMTWILMSQANMNMPLGNPADKGRREWKLPSRLWDDLPIPNTVAPSFDTCNISRRYELEVRVGLAHGVAGGVRPELIVLPLRLPVTVYSGIAPPPALLQAIANRPRPQHIPSPLFSRPTDHNGALLPPDTPSDAPTTPTSEICSSPAQVGSYQPQGQGDIPDVAPPSYEDAMAEEIAPVDGPRRDYHVPAPTRAQEHAFNADSKGSGLGRRVSERLFGSNGAATPLRTVSSPSSLQGVTIAENGAGGHRSSGSTSFAAIGAALIPTIITAGIFLFAFLLLRSKYRNIYAPRTYFRTLSQKDRTPSSSSHTFVSWYHDFRALDDKFILRHSSLEAYLFLRYLRMIVLICGIGCCLTWPILFPVNATGGGDASQLDKISFSNVLDRKRLYAHAVVAWVFFGFIILLITRERLFVIGLRRAHQTIPLNATRLSSRIVLFLSVPPGGLREDNLHRYFGENAVRSWVVSDLGHLESVVRKRNSKIDSLEELELQLLKKVNLARDGARHGHTPAMESSDTQPKAVDERHRPKHRSKYVIGKKIDSISQLREEISTVVSNVDRVRDADSSEPTKRTGAIFVEFRDQASAHQAFQQVRHPSPLMLQPKYIGVQPKEVIWQNLNLDTSRRITYSYIAIGIAMATVILWSIPIGIIGTISNINYLTDKFPFLRFINKLPDLVLGLLTGLVPPLLLSTVVSYVPHFFKHVAILSGKPTTTEAARWAQMWYFVFQVVQVFLVTTFSSGAAAVANKIANEPMTVPTLLAKNLPKASNFYLTYFVIQGLGTASKNIVNYSDLFLYLFYYNILDKTPRQKFNTHSQMKGISWFNVYPKFTNLAVIAIAYSCIAPLVLGFAAVGVFLFYLSYRYNLFYVIQVKVETRGESYTRALQHLMTGVYLAELCLIGLFGIKQAPGPSTLMTVLLVGTIIHHLTVNQYLAPLEHYMPVDVLSDEERPLLGADEEVTRPRMDQVEQSRVYKLGAGKVPTILLDPLATFLEPRIFASQEALRRWLKDPEGEFEESHSYSNEQIRNAYLNPALTSKTPQVWLPKDRKGISKLEVGENERAGLPSTDEGAELSSSNEIVWNTDDFTTVPIFKEATRY
ncbi:uncharacterized protein Z518_02372 [Rhinocladiella mackenziei CBS 650.93]|uniref:Rhinocladiella mackenziei CBS 650.93 unplaced genomic scaffold supercont1.2, whole genome shotgun sequence n=1 Tax=Rhinocladiella mackenziei CBS 650.93 TaxID=1442369 RepID=A0A0D2HBA1_9EURO|nr:uncharacterized protein Z518_02372 [Rhinocladiella mackenziei CBS 650.93]KIX07718.1 hypothetical protein Z518_02372 [Rhinocladiella mackenziei CBS 650.93]